MDGTMILTEHSARLWRPRKNRVRVPTRWTGFALNQAAVNVVWVSGSTNIPYGSNVGLGDLLVLVFVGIWTPGGALNITDSQTNSWSQAVGFNPGGSGGSGCAIAWAVAKSGSACTITAQPTGISHGEYVAYDFSGFGGSAAVDQTASGFGGTGTDSVGPVTTLFANEVGIAAFNFAGSASGGNWNFLVTAHSNLTEYIILTSTGSQTATASPGGSAGDLCSLATFYSSASSVLPTDTIFYGMT